MAYQWISLDAKKVSGNQFRVWLLSAGYPPPALKAARQTIARYILQEGDGVPTEFRDRFSGEAVLPSQGGWQFLLPRASDLILTPPGPDGLVATESERQAELFATITRFIELWNQRRGTGAGNDLISMLANDPATGGEDPYAYVGNLILLIVAGSDTTRHSITGALLAMNETPDVYRRLGETPALLENAVPEIIRWQSPVAHMRRTALSDHQLGGKTIRKGDKVVMWYVSGNRDETVIDNPDAFIIDRPRPRQHVAFGFGVHRCVGNRLAEMQLRIVWEEILKRFPHIEIMDEPRRLRSNFVKGYETLPVRIPA